MNKLPFFLLLLSLLLCGCSNAPDFISFSTLANKKINNLVDIDGDRKSDLIFWNTTSMSSSDTFLEACFFEIIDSAKDKYSKHKIGEISDIPFSGYFNDDQIVDIGVYRTYPEGESEWFIKSGNSEDHYNIKLGSAGDIPIPSDYDGDGKTDIVIFKPTVKSFQGILTSSNVPFKLDFKVDGDIPVTKDYDGDGVCDFAIYNSKNGNWFVKPSGKRDLINIQLGGPYFLPIPSDYDGDGKCDYCAWNYNTGEIKLLLSTLSRPVSNELAEKVRKALKGKNIIPVPLDYDGDGRAELAFWDSSVKSIISFDVNNDFRKKTKRLGKISNSLPITNFLLNRFYLNGWTVKSPVIVNKEEIKFLILNKDKITSIQKPVESLTKHLPSKSVNLFNLNKKDNIVPFVSDFDGDYSLDFCLWSVDTGTYLCRSSRLGGNFALQLGVSSDLPAVGNFNFDNISDLAVYRQSLRMFIVRYLGKSMPKEEELIKLSDDAGINSFPIAGDFDGDKIDDFAVFNPSKNIFIVKKSSSSKEIKYEICSQKNCTNSLIPLRGDFDGDLTDDPAGVNIQDKKFIFYSSLNGVLQENTLSAVNGNVAFTADLDGDLKSDIFFYDPNNTNLGICQSKQNWKYMEIKFTDVAAGNLKKVKLVNCPRCNI